MVIPGALLTTLAASINCSNHSNEKMRARYLDKKMLMRNASDWLAQRTFAVVLALLGIGLRIACRCSERFRSQLTRPVTIQISSAYGVCHCYVFSLRTAQSHAGVAAQPTLSLCFDTALQCLVTLLSPYAVGRIVHALLARSATYQGNAVFVLWFFGLTRFVLPIGRQRPLAVPLPDAFIAPNPHSNVSERIVREPARAALDANWPMAHQQYKKMAMTRGCAGEPIPMW